MLLSDASCPTTSLITQQSIVVSAVTISGIFYHSLVVQELDLIDSPTLVEHVMVSFFSCLD